MYTVHREKTRHSTITSRYVQLNMLIKDYSPNNFIASPRFIFDCKQKSFIGEIHPKGIIFFYDDHLENINLSMSLVIL